MSQWSSWVSGHCKGWVREHFWDIQHLSIPHTKHTEGITPYISIVSSLQNTQLLKVFPTYYNFLALKHNWSGNDFFSYENADRNKKSLKCLQWEMLLKIYFSNWKSNGIGFSWKVFSFSMKVCSEMKFWFLTEETFQQKNSIKFTLKRQNLVFRE